MSKLFIRNANIISFHKKMTPALNALWVENGIIKAIAPDEFLAHKVDGNTTCIDAKGKTVMPGFNDSHIHIWKVGNLKTYMLDVRGVASKSALLDMLSDYVKLYPDALWITARGFNEAAWLDKKMPNKHDLDSINTSKPIYLIRTCAHIAICNSTALKIAGVNKDTIVPQGGEIRMGSDGHPNGIITETALGIITAHIPPPTKEQLKKMVIAARSEMYAYGITAATDPAVDPLLLAAYQEMNEDKSLGFRLNVMPIILPDGSKEPFPIPNAFDTDFLKLNTVKFFSDGGLSGKTAALKRAYKNTTEKGVLRLHAEQYENLCRLAMQKGLGVATHAIGDDAIRFVIEKYILLHKHFPNNLKRIEHLGLPHTKDLQEMAAHQIAASMQTIFLRELGRNFIEYLDEAYLKQCYPVKSAMHYGVNVALSSDAPVVKDFNPISGICAAINRQADNGSVISPGESISIEQALSAYTQNAATISGLENYGYIDEGAKADFIMLNQNPLTTSKENISSLKVCSTFINGKQVFG